MSLSVEGQFFIRYLHRGVATILICDLDVDKSIGTWVGR